MSEAEIEYLIPPELEERVEKLMKGLVVPGQHMKLMAYVGGWIKQTAKIAYKELVQRDGIPSDPKVISLLCEIAVLRALVSWHEVRDRPPPMPTISNL